MGLFSSELTKKILTTLAISRPIIPMNKNEPRLVKSLLVVYPYKLAAANVADVMKNTFAMLAVVNIMKIELKLSPIVTAYV